VLSHVARAPFSPGEPMLGKHLLLGWLHPPQDLARSRPHRPHGCIDRIDRHLPLFEFRRHRHTTLASLQVQGCRRCCRAVHHLARSHTPHPGPQALFFRSKLAKITKSPTEQRGSRQFLVRRNLRRIRRKAVIDHSPSVSTSGGNGDDRSPESPGHEPGMFFEQVRRTHKSQNRKTSKVIPVGAKPLKLMWALFSPTFVPDVAQTGFCWYTFEPPK